MHTPWGQSDYQIKYGEGITFYGTPSHGGFRVLKKQNQKIPVYMRREDGWYEEDCDWCLVAIIFPEMFEEKPLLDAHDTFKNWHWLAYEVYHRVTLKDGESYTKDQANFEGKNKDNFVVTSALSVNKDVVKVCAKKKSTQEERWFYVPDSEYKMNFVIDLDKHRDAPAGF